MSHHQIHTIKILITITPIFVAFLYFLNKFLSDQSVKDLMIPKKRFVLLVLQWCSVNLGTIQSPYNLKIHYYQHSQWGGRYDYASRLILIYVFKDQMLNDLAEIVIHEYTHYLQSARKDSGRDYQKQTNEVGYWHNPFEIEAREVAKQNKKACMNWVLSEISKTSRKNPS